MKKSKKTKKIILTLSTLIILTIIYLKLQGSAGPPPRKDWQKETVRSEIGQLGGQSYKSGSTVNAYLKFYGLDVGDNKIKHKLGVFSTGQYELAGHLFLPTEPKGTVVILHGYLVHTGQLNRIIGHLTDAGYAVGCYDMIGHGLSDGKAGAVKSFGDYSKSLEDFITTIKPQCPGPCYLLAHSAGGAAALDYLWSGKGDEFENIILIAPLVRSSFWGLSKFGRSLFGKLIKSVPRKFQVNTSDKEFLDFVKNKDPLQVRQVPIEWVAALHKWNDTLDKKSILDREILIIQGDKDSTVDWKWNVKFLKNKFPNAKVEIIIKGRHELLNELEEMREDVYAKIVTHIESVNSR